MNTPTQNLILKHAPDLRFMFGMIPDVEILDRAMEDAIDDAVNNAVEEATAPLYTEADVQERVAEGIEYRTDEVIKSIMESYALAMRSAGVSDDKVDEIQQTVEDAASNNL